MSDRKKSNPIPIPTSKPKIRSYETPKIEESDKLVRSKNRYIKLKVGSKIEEINEVMDKVKNNEVKWAFYGVDNGVGYHYYVILKK